MAKECFNCAEPTTERYTLVLGSDSVLEDSSVCGDCATAFGEEGWIEVRKSRFAETD